MASIKEMDLNPDTYIGLKLPLRKDNILDFSSTQTIFEQSEYNIKNLLLTQRILNLNLRLLDLMKKQ